MTFLKNTLAGQPNIAYVVGSSNAFTQGGSATFIMREAGSHTVVLDYRVDENYLPMLGISVIEGRAFDAASEVSDQVLVNETFLKALGQDYGIEDPVGFALPRAFGGIGQPKILGVVRIPIRRRGDGRAVPGRRTVELRHTVCLGVGRSHRLPGPLRPDGIDGPPAHQGNRYP